MALVDEFLPPFDWARQNNDTSFLNLIVKKAKDYYLADSQIPAHLEPDGRDFFSPSLLEADLMQRFSPRHNL